MSSFTVLGTKQEAVSGTSTTRHRSALALEPFPPRLEQDLRHLRRAALAPSIIESACTLFRDSAEGSLCFFTPASVQRLPPSTVAESLSICFYLCENISETSVHQVPIMTDWSKLKVAELKDELKSRGIPLTGLKLKVDFVAKLEELEIPDVANIDEKEAEATAVPRAGPAAPESQTQLVGAREEPAVIRNDAPAENLHNGKMGEQPHDDGPEEQANNATLPEMVDMYSASQLKPTPSQPLTEILAAKEVENVEHQNPVTPPIVAVDKTSNVSTPVPARELIDDSKKRKRRSATPPPSTQDVALKKAKGRDGTPVITKQESSLERMQAATDAAEAIQAPDGLGDDVPIKEDVPGPRGDADTKPSQSIENATGNEQAALRSPSPTHRAESAWMHSDRNVPHALHPATRSLYLRDFKRPLQVPMLRNHLTEIAQTPSNSSAEDPITTFHLDNIRTHALVSFDSIATAARVRSAMHQSVFPDEASRMPIWVDFIPDDEIDAWILRETSSSDRNRKWEVVYNDGANGVIAVHQEVDAAGPPRQPSAIQPRHISMSEALSRPLAPPGPGVRPDRASLVPAQKRDSYDRGLPMRSDPKPVVVPTSDTGTGFKALDELFSSTTTKPKLYYKSVPTSIAEDRLEMIKDLRVTHSEMGRSGDEGMKRYSFEVYKGREEWVDKGPEFGYGRRGIDALSGRRGRGGGYRGSRGDSRGRGGDSWRGRY